MHSFFDRLKDIGLFDATGLNAVLRKLLLRESFQSVVGALDLLPCSSKSSLISSLIVANGDDLRD